MRAGGGGRLFALCSFFSGCSGENIGVGFCLFYFVVLGVSIGFF